MRGATAMRHFPAFLDLRGRPVLLLGAGEAAGRKAALLHAAGAEIRHADAFDPAGLAGCALAIGAGADEAALRALSAAARAAGIPVNVVDRPELCSFITPAIVDRDPITVAISTGGAAPVLARLLRARIEAAVPPAFGRLAALAAAFQAEIRARLPDLAARRRVLERLFAGRAADLVFAGHDDAARAEFSRALAHGADPAGAVFIVGAGPGAADLLTLRGQRLLGEADAIVHGPAAPAAVLDLARRDAERVALDDGAQAGPVLGALAAAGRRVVWLVPGTPAPGAAESLLAAGLAVEIVPGVPAGERAG